MKIARTGSAANHGTSEINLPTPKFEWSAAKSAIVIRHGRVKDFTTTSNHSYNIEVTAPELISLLETLALSALKEPDLIEKLFTPSLKSLVQLNQIVAGLHRITY